MSYRHAIGSAIAALAALAMLLSGLAAAAQESDMAWQFYEANDPDNKGRMTARLVYGVPETDNVQVTGVCEARASTSTRFSMIRLGADIGDLKNDQAVKLRFSGGGFEHEIDGVVARPQTEEGVTGVVIRPEHDDPLWAALTEKKSIDYLVPGYRAAPLKLDGGADKIRSFLAACKTYQEAQRPKTDQQTSPRETQSARTISEKEAFEGAKELGTVAAWEAYLNNFPTGFRADLARAYIKRLGQAAAKPEKPATPTAGEQVTMPATAPLQMVNLGPGNAPWRTGNRIVASAGNHSVFTASVQGRGLELVTYCVDWSRTGGAGHGLQAVLRENPRGVYPDFEGRMAQGLAAAPTYQAGKKIQMSFSSGKSFTDMTAQRSPGSGEVIIGDSGQAISQGLAFKEMLGARTMTINAPPFSATFQLTNSRAAVCEVFRRCGATNRPECAKFAPKPKRPQKKTVKKRPTSRCGSGSVWLEGQCVPRSQVTAFCGPGYKRSGSKCVSRYPDPPQQAQPQPSNQQIIRNCQALAIACSAGVQAACKTASTYCDRG